MGLLTQILGTAEPSDSLLGLSSRYTMPRDVRESRDREVGKSIARTQVIEADMRGVQHATAVAIHAAESITALAETAAARHPYERAGTDAVAEMGKLVLVRKIAELGGM